MANALCVPSSTKVLSVKWAKHQGNVYRSNLVVCIKVHCEMPIFHTIQSILVKDNQQYVVIFALNTLFLCEHFNVFEVVQRRKGPHVVDFKDIFYHRSFDIQIDVLWW